MGIPFSSPCLLQEKPNLDRAAVGTKATSPRWPTRPCPAFSGRASLHPPSTLDSDPRPPQLPCASLLVSVSSGGGRPPVIPTTPAHSTVPAGSWVSDGGRARPTPALRKVTGCGCPPPVEALLRGLLGPVRMWRHGCSCDRVEPRLHVPEVLGEAKGAWAETPRGQLRARGPEGAKPRTGRGRGAEATLGYASEAPRLSAHVKARVPTS